MSENPALEYLQRVHEQAANAANGYGTQAQADAVMVYGPTGLLRRVTAERELLADLQAECHVVTCDPWYTCAAATPERDGWRCEDDRHGKPCDCGLDERVERRIRLLAKGWGWEETP